MVTQGVEMTSNGRKGGGDNVAASEESLGRAEAKDNEWITQRRWTGVVTEAKNVQGACRVSGVAQSS